MIRELIVEILHLHMLLLQASKHPVDSPRVGLRAEGGRLKTRVEKVYEDLTEAIPMSVAFTDLLHGHIQITGHEQKHLLIRVSLNKVVNYLHGRVLCLLIPRCVIRMEIDSDYQGRHAHRHLR